MSLPDAHMFSAVEAAEAIRSGRLSSVDLVKACLNRIDETDGDIGAWAHLDPEEALAQAKEADRIRKAGYATGPLHGVPVGLKDVIDTRDMPTERGTPIFAGRMPETDACLVDRLKEAGAVIMGKTVTTELAFVHASETRNPHNRDRSPGGSSAGSAAAVAAGQIPLAVGTQTNGSVIRPASFNGTFGFKPTRGTISRRGVLETSRSLDQVGVFATSIEDAALLVDAIGSYDPTDTASFARPRARCLEGARADVPVEPDFLWLDMPYFDRLDDDARDGMEAVLEALGGRVTRMDAAPNMNTLIEVQLTIHLYEIVHHLEQTFDDEWRALSPSIRPQIEKGRGISKAQYDEALEIMASTDAVFADIFTDYDAIIAPSATGQAPVFGPHTGDPIFCTIWTLAGLPALSMPLLVGNDDLPIGVQLIGGIERDDRLMRTASWLQKSLQAHA